jgi:hypothetical protein
MATRVFEQPVAGTVTRAREQAPPPPRPATWARGSAATMATRAHEQAATAAGAATRVSRHEHVGARAGATAAGARATLMAHPARRAGSKHT